MGIIVPSKTCRDRLEVLAPLVKEGSVLDLGVADSWPAKAATEKRVRENPALLFRRLAEINPSVVGVDLDEEGVAALRSEGYQVVAADVETMRLDREFDVIVAGEIIEHLENPGRLLRNLRRHLKPRGTLAVSTPNPFYAKQRHKIWRYRRPEVHDEHTCWFDPVTLSQLLSRTGFEPYDGYWIQPERKLLKTWSRLLRGYFSHSFLILAHPRQVVSERQDGEE